MTLVIENGSQVASANSYTTDAEFVAYALARGYSIASTEALRDVLQIKAIDYLESLESKYQGTRVSSTQVLSFPRYNVMLHGFILASDTIPNELKNAQMELAYQLFTQEILISETIGSSDGDLTGFSVDGVYSETYASGGSSGTKVTTGKANAYLTALLNPRKDLQRV